MGNFELIHRWNHNTLIVLVNIDFKGYKFSKKTKVSWQTLLGGKSKLSRQEGKKEAKVIGRSKSDIAAQTADR